MKSWVLKIRYPEEIVDKQMSKVKFNFSRKTKPKSKVKKDVPPIVT